MQFPFVVLGRDDCTNGTHSCDVNAVCNNTQGILNCSCIDGFVGDGLVCTGNYKENIKRILSEKVDMLVR